MPPLSGQVNIITNHARLTAAKLTHAGKPRGAKQAHLYGVALGRRCRFHEL